MTDYPMPQRPGVYLARTHASRIYNAIINVTGVSPFLDAWVWYMDSNETGRIREPDKIVWGPEIVIPKGGKDGDTD